MSIEKIIYFKICPECYSRHIKSDDIHKEIYCGKCGLVIQAPYQYGIVFPDFPFKTEEIFPSKRKK